MASALAARKRAALAVRGCLVKPTIDSIDLHAEGDDAATLREEFYVVVRGSPNTPQTNVSVRLVGVISGLFLGRRPPSSYNDDGKIKEYKASWHFEAGELSIVHAKTTSEAKEAAAKWADADERRNPAAQTYPVLDAETRVEAADAARRAAEAEVVAERTQRMAAEERAKAAELEAAALRERCARAEAAVSELRAQQPAEAAPTKLHAEEAEVPERLVQDEVQGSASCPIVTPSSRGAASSGGAPFLSCSETPAPAGTREKPTPRRVPLSDVSNGSQQARTAGRTEARADAGFCSPPSAVPSNPGSASSDGSVPTSFSEKVRRAGIESAKRVQEAKEAADAAAGVPPTAA